MAKVFPQRLEGNVSPAESRLYGLLADQLADDFSVFHGVAWLERSRGREPADGEADFVIGHPRLGVMVVEVKGGIIRCDGRNDRWYSMDRAGGSHGIKDPFAQVTRESYALRRVAEALPDWPAHRVRVCRAVAFPDITYSRPMTTDGPAEIVIDADDLHRIAERIAEIYDWWSFSGSADADGGAPGTVGMRALEVLLARSFTIDSPLSLAVAEDERAIVTLSHEQFALLDVLRHQRRALILGVAGSGKTLLAAEHARRLARQGMRVLLTCFNRPLADHLASTVGRDGGVDVFTFHGLAETVAKEARIMPEPRYDDPRWWDIDLPDLLDQAAKKLNRRYDAIIVDEAQDIDAVWWLPLLDLLEDRANGILYVFGDANQDLYHTDPAEIGVVIPDALPVFPLNENRRSTRSIHDFAQRFATADPAVGRSVALGPAGRRVEILSYPTVTRDDSVAGHRGSAPARACRESLRDVVEKLVKGGLSTRDIVVLTPRSRKSSWLLGGPSDVRLGLYRLVPEALPDNAVAPAPGPLEVRVATIHRFKGLESPVVILAEIDGRVAPDALPGLIYVGATRARSHLVVIADESRALGLSGQPSAA